MRSSQTQVRTVFYGHAAYSISRYGLCKIPANTTFTLYTPLGALVDAPIADALANGEQITATDLMRTDAGWFFVLHKMEVPIVQESPALNEYPRQFKAGEVIPNFFLNPDSPKRKDFLPLNPVPTEVVCVEETTFLSDLLRTHAGKDIHWGACTFAKTIDESAIAYGYEYRLSYTSPLKELYKPTPKVDRYIRNTYRVQDSPYRLFSGAVQGRQVTGMEITGRQSYRSDRL